MSEKEKACYNCSHSGVCLYYAVCTESAKKLEDILKDSGPFPRIGDSFHALFNAKVSNAIAPIIAQECTSYKEG